MCFMWSAHEAVAPIHFGVTFSFSISFCILLFVSWKLNWTMYISAIWAKLYSYFFSLCLSLSHSSRNSISRYFFHPITMLQQTMFSTTDLNNKTFQQTNPSMKIRYGLQWICDVFFSSSSSSSSFGIDATIHF